MKRTAFVTNAASPVFGTDAPASTPGVPAVHKGATVTAIVSESPSAGAASQSVTFVASVTPKRMGPAPTGGVTFAYYTVGHANGGPKSGTLGVTALRNGKASYTTSPGQLPVGGSNNGSITITASYSGDTFHKASQGSIIYYVTTSCMASPWPALSNGYPHVVAYGPEGYYIGQSNGWFTVYATHPGTSIVDFTGAISTDGLILHVSSTKDEGRDFVKLQGSSELKFRLVDHGSLDGFTFFAGCGSLIKFRLDIANAKAPTSEIFLGATASDATRNAVVFERRD